MSLETLTHALNKLHLPHTHQERLTLILGTAALLGTSSLLLPAAYRDYRTFKSYGPGALPNNFVGWLTVRMLLQPFKREMFSTEEYVRRVDAAEGHGKGDEGFLTLSEKQLEARRGEERPVVGPHVVPQRQLTQIPEEAVVEVSDFGLILGVYFGLELMGLLIGLCRSSGRNSSPLACAITTLSSFSNRTWRAMRTGFSWRITSRLRIWRRRWRVRLRIYTREMTTRHMLCWRRRIVSTSFWTS